MLEGERVKRVRQPPNQLSLGVLGTSHRIFRHATRTPSYTQHHIDFKTDRVEKKLKKLEWYFIRMTFDENCI